MSICSYLARIDEVREKDFGGLSICLIEDTNKFGLWWDPSKENLEKLKEDFGIVNNRDLVNRDCIIQYDGNIFANFSQNKI